ncbi:MAG TPA: FG-GAP-like repeat-containing protein [Halococcus sp.]|nr:FG-GAP-like repeat-containing protein [Halococcus sp.]
MRARTGLAAALIVAALAGTAVLGFSSVTDSGGTLTEKWVSNTKTGILGNHHAPAAGIVGGRGMVFAPISGEGDTHQCRLVAMNADSATPRWRYHVPPANCTIHSVADPALADFDGDGQKEVIATTTEEVVVAFDPLTGKEEFRHELTDYGYTQPVVADLTGDTTPEIVVVDFQGMVFVLRPNGTTVWKKNLASQTEAQPAVDDFDGDGGREVAVGTGTRVILVEGNGTIAWNTTKPFDSTVTWMTTGQADGDSALEIVAATFGGRVVVLDGNHGTVQWRKDLGDLAAVHAFGDGDSDGTPEVYAVAKDGTLRSLDATDGTVEWTTQLTTEEVQMTPPPSMGDIDGDGNPELVAVTNTGIVSVADPKSGDIRASYEREVPIYVHPTIANTDGDDAAEIYVIYGDGRVVALSYEK